ncbi:hypothetical protein QT381_14785 [Galbitalea sp. SE-J8]|uniref:hypothetical protein n=1 Tax=Galbitalea sp. SE-J8 TaxID=3054952 RepID=UPI00259D2D4E|nr:hypothetical protein [Galbitalea sp. SE-J8]MDM4764271.1 hypothetical protein [Galbitalea sp. SE-J8]
MRGERAQLPEFLQRDEASRNGAYILLGDDDTAPSGTQARIGRASNCRREWIASDGRTFGAWEAREA